MEIAFTNFKEINTIVFLDKGFQKSLLVVGGRPKKHCPCNNDIHV